MEELIAAPIHDPGADHSGSADTLSRYAIIVESMTEGVSLSSEDGIIVYTNPAEDRMFGFQRGELVGQHVSVQNAYPDEENRRRVEEVILHLRTHGCWEGEWLNRRKDGSDFVTESRITAVELDGRTHWLCVQRDVTKIRNAEAALKTSEERLELALEGTGLGIYDLDLTTGEGHWSDTAFRLLGHEPTPNGQATLAMWLDQLYPEDAPKVLLAHERAELMGEPLVLEYRVRRADTGETSWLSTFGRIMRSPTGLRSVGTVVGLDERKRIEEEMRESAQRLDIAVRAHGIGIFDWHIPSGRVVWSEEEERLFGLPTGTFGGDISNWTEFLIPEDGETMHARMSQAMAEKRESLDFSFRIRRTDGAIRWIEGSSRFLYADDGTPERMVGTNMDVTERKRAEEHQRLLVNELNHRVKNTLAIVQGIAQQTFRGVAEARDARTAFEGRLAALSATHDLLTHQNWEAASILKVIEDALRPYDERQIVIDGPDLRLPPKTAVALALAIHELATNAAKYGALSVPQGRVGIGWKACSNRLHLVWRERGGPLVVPPQSRGFGTRMIERGLAAEFGGTARIEFASEGVTCSLDAELPRLDESLTSSGE